MCRPAAYLGLEIPLERFLLEPEHNLQRQSRESLEMEETRMNIDGFGFGWYHDGQPQTYVNTRLMWPDIINLESLRRSLSGSVSITIEYGQ